MQDRSASDNPARNASGLSILRESDHSRGRRRFRHNLRLRPLGPVPGFVVGARVGAGSGAAVVSGVGVDIGIAAGADVLVGARVGAGLEQANSAATVTRIAQCSSFDMLDLLHLKILSSRILC